VIAVIAHAVLQNGALIAKETWLRQMTFLAAGLPAFAAAIRIHRDTREYRRNALRHKATYNALDVLDRRLQAETTPAGIFRTIGFCEQVLEADTREWMRLISESEWFG
jgi:SMODS and SLOG-associating 2TM effector domain 1